MRIIDLDTTELGPADIITQGETSPLRLRRQGADVGVILPVNLYESLLRPAPEDMRPKVDAFLKKMMVERSDLFRALARHERDHPED